MRKNRYLLLGHAEHFKDGLAEILSEEFGITYSGSSYLAAKIFIYDLLKEKYGYKSFEECFEDRRNHRKEWHDLICEYNAEDKARLAKEILKQSQMYVGMRSPEEIAECKRQGLFDLIIGVFRPDYPLESKDSFGIDLWKECDLVIPNAGTIEEFRKKVIKLEHLFI